MVCAALSGLQGGTGGQRVERQGGAQTMTVVRHAGYGCHAAYAPAVERRSAARMRHTPVSQATTTE